MQVSRFWAREDETACQADRIPHRVFADSSTNTQPVQTCATLYIVVQYWFQCRPEAEDDCLHPNGAPAARACRADQKRHAQAGGADHVRNASGRRVPSVPRHRAQGAGTAEKGRTHRDPHGIGQLCGVQRRRYERSGRLGLRLAAFRSADHHGTAVHRIGRPTFGVGGGRASANGSTKSRAAGSSGRRRSRTRSRICPPSRRCARSSNEWKDSWTAPSRKP